MKYWATTGFSAAHSVLRGCSRAMRRGVPALLVGALMCLVAASCNSKAAKAPAPAAAPTISVAHPKLDKVVDFVDFTGRTGAKQAVNVMPLVNGQLIPQVKVFKEGSEVVEGEPLFEIDPTLFQAQVDLAKAQLSQNEANLKLAKITLERDKTSGVAIAVSQQQIDQDKAAVEAADAKVKGAEATLKAANKNLSYTHIPAPISGRISRIYLTPFNVVTANSSLLTTIVSMNPMYAYFDIDDNSYNRLNKAINEGKAPDPSAKTPTSQNFDKKDPLANKVLMALGNETGYPLSGDIDFINNQFNPSTGTITVRGVFQNQRPAGGMWRIEPGMFVRIRLPIGEAEVKQLVIDRAIGSDQGLKFVYIVDSENKAQYRRVETGSLQDNGLRVIEPYKKWKDEKTGKDQESGIKQDEWVVVSGLPQIRPKTLIQPDQIAMPELSTNLNTISRRDAAQPPPPGQKTNGVPNK